MDARYFWLIWSNDHMAWWAPGEQGYVKERSLAGRFAFSNACELVFNANAHVMNSEEPHEAMVRDESKCCRAPMIDFVQCEKCGSRY